MSGDFERLHNSHYSRFQFRPQSFYDFSRSSNNNNNRYQPNNNNPSLPLSAYMNTDDSFKGTTYSRRRSTQQRPYHQDKHQFPLSSYDPRQYGFNNNTQKRNDINNRSNTNRQSMNNNNNEVDIDLIEEWWEDNNTDLIGIDTSIKTTTTVDDSGNSSLSTSMNLKETTLDDFVNPPSDVSTTDSMLNFHQTSFFSL